MKLVYEEYRDFADLFQTLGTRKNNKVMADCHSSDKADKEFSGTSSYAEAVKLLKTGYNDIAKKLKDDVKQKDRIQSKYVAVTEHPHPHTAVQGFIPHVPNSLLNLPNSMISIDRKPMKRKTLQILYFETGNCSEEQKYFIEAGSALLSAVSLIEKAGIQTKIDSGFFAGYKGNKEHGEMALATVRIKNFGERYSFQKVSFPLAHPSMFRRIGFKWLETVPDLTNEDFAYGYGRPPSHEQLLEELKLASNTYMLSTHWIHQHDNSVEEILKYLEVI